MRIIKNNRGISLISVIITLILMLIILSSIIYSSSRTSETKKLMLINSDIEELNKRVELYYLENGALPIEKDRYSVYNYGANTSTTPVFYRLKISSLENLNLNNLEIINEENKALDEGDQQWYVINEETHLIYFVKNIDGEIVTQDAKYTKEYASTLGKARAKITFNVEKEKEEENTEEIAVSDTTVGIESDEITDGTTSISNNSSRFIGNANPLEIGGEGIYPACYDYYGYSNGYDWIPGAKANNGLVLHYDGELNASTANNELYHSDNTKTWKDVSGNGLDGTIVSGTWSLSYKDSKTESDSRTSNDSSTWGKKAINLSNSEYVLRDFCSGGNVNTGSIFPGNNSDFTYEICFYKDSESTQKTLFSSGISNTVGTLAGSLSNGNTTATGGNNTNISVGSVDINVASTFITLQGNYTNGNYYCTYDRCKPGKTAYDDYSTPRADFNMEFASDYDSVAYSLYPFKSDSNTFTNIYGTNINCPWNSIKSPRELITSGDYYRKDEIDQTFYNVQCRGYVAHCCAVTWLGGPGHGKSETCYKWRWTYSANINLTGNDNFKNNARNINITNKVSTNFGKEKYEDSNTLSTGVHTVTVTYKASNKQIKTYIDGVLKSTTTKSSDPSTYITEFVVGADNKINGSYNSSTGLTITNSYCNYLNSAVYNVRVYNNVLSDQNISDNYMVDRARFRSGL